jgi:hypothetical protein
MIRKHLSYANVVATAALFVALGGSAYAVSQITSSEIKNDTIRSADLRDRKAVKGADVKRDSLGGRQIAEQALDASRFARVVGAEPGGCEPGPTFADCAAVGLTLNRRSHLLIAATGGQRSQGGAVSSARCEVRIDEASQNLGAFPGESANLSHGSAGATNGFARTLVTPDPIRAGAHDIALACRQETGDVRIENPTIAAIAIATK